MQPQTVAPAQQSANQINPSTGSLQIALPVQAEELVSDLSTIKTGYKTSEFWITIATASATLAAGLLPANSPVVKAVSAASAGVLAVIYLIGRVQLKKHATTTAASLSATASNV